MDKGLFGYGNFSVTAVGAELHFNLEGWDSDELRSFAHRKETIRPMVSRPFRVKETGMHLAIEFFIERR